MRGVIQTTSHPSSPMILTPTPTTRTDNNKRPRRFVYLPFLTTKKVFVSGITLRVAQQNTLQNCVILEFALLCFIR